MGKIVSVEKNGYIHEGFHYDYKECGKLIKKLGTNREIVILEESLLVKVYDFEISKNSIEKFVDNIITKDFTTNQDLLFHYDFIKAVNKVYVYSIKKGLVVEKIINGAKNISILPIQFKIKKIINIKLKKYKNFISITKIKDSYYLINVEENFIINGVVNENIDKVLKEFFKYNKVDKAIIFDKSIELDLEDKLQDIKEIKYLKIGELINEKVFKKQKFYTKRLC